MSITFVNDYATISTSEYSLPGDTTTGVPTSQTAQGQFQFVVDLGNMAAGDQYRLRLYEKYAAAGTQRLVEEWIYTNEQSKPLFVSPAFFLGAGWDFTCIRLAGADRTIYWSIRRNDAALSAADIDNVHDEVVEGSLTFRQVTRLMLAVLAGKSSGGGTSTVAFRDNADGKNRISATVDANNNRTAITLDGT